MKRLILVGGGHAHLFVLKHLAQTAHGDVEVVLISPTSWQYYSGMLPGWIAGHYCLDECRIDLRPLMEEVNVRFIQDAVVGMDADKRCVCLSNGRQVHYDLLSLDVGSETNCEWLADLGPLLLPIKPLNEFLDSWQKVVEEAESRKEYHLVVVGGGAAGVELALAAKYALGKINSSARVILVSGDAGLIRNHSDAVRHRVKKALHGAGIELISRRAVGIESGIMLDDGTCISADRVIATSGARAPEWLAMSKLSLDMHGYVLVNEYHRSLSHPDVFAAGDVCARRDVSLERSGVHAVRAGPILAKNLMAFLDGQGMKAFVPRRRTLYLLACGDRYAIASWGSLSTEGRWVWRWKDWIDRRFVGRFSEEKQLPA